MEAAQPRIVPGRTQVWARLRLSATSLLALCCISAATGCRVRGPRTPRSPTPSAASPIATAAASSPVPSPQPFRLPTAIKSADAGDPWFVVVISTSSTISSSNIPIVISIAVLPRTFHTREEAEAEALKEYPHEQWTVVQARSADMARRSVEPLLR